MYIPMSTWLALVFTLKAANDILTKRRLYVKKNDKNFSLNASLLSSITCVDLLFG